MKKSRRQQANRKRGRARRQRRAALTAFCVALALAILALSAYVGWWYINRSRVQGDARRYADLYEGRDNALTVTVTAIPTAEPAPEVTPEPTAAPAPETTAEPTAEPTPEPTAVVTAEATAVITASPTAAPTAEPTVVITEAPTPVVTDAPTPEPTEAPTPEPTATPAPFGADMPLVEDELIPTPGADTRVYALPTAPPAQPGFSKLLAVNPETVGFLEIDGMLSLPVVQRENDNGFYLSHSFEGAEAQEGTLFMDGLNRLVPEDDCLLVYGHNMKNRTMFGKLDQFEDLAYLRQHSVIHFDTLYENRSYVAFAAFTASMEPGNRRYFDVRQFIFDDVEFDKFVLKLQSRSMFKIPVDVRYGDRLLLLVTCDYTNAEGRFILALRQVRSDETEAGVWAQAMQASIK